MGGRVGGRAGGRVGGRVGGQASGLFKSDNKVTLSQQSLFELSN